MEKNTQLTVVSDNIVASNPTDKSIFERAGYAVGKVNNTVSRAYENAGNTVKDIWNKRRVVVMSVALGAAALTGCSSNDAAPTAGSENAAAVSEDQGTESGTTSTTSPEAVEDNEADLSGTDTGDVIGVTEAGKCIVESNGKLFEDLGHMDLSPEMNSEQIKAAFIAEICNGENGINVDIVASNFAMIQEGLLGVDVNDVNEFIRIQNEYANQIAAEMSADEEAAIAYAKDLIALVQETSIVESSNGVYIYDISGQQDSSVYFGEGGLFTLVVTNVNGSSSFVMEFTRENGTTFTVEIGKCAQPRVTPGVPTTPEVVPEPETFTASATYCNVNDEIVTVNGEGSTQEEAQANVDAQIGERGDCTPEEVITYTVCTGLDADGNKINETFNTQAEANDAKDDCEPVIPQTYTVCTGLDADGNDINETFDTQEEADAARNDCEPIVIEYCLNPDGSIAVDENGNKIPKPTEEGAICKVDNNGEDGNGTPGTEEESGVEEENGHDNHGDITDPETQDPDSEGTDEETPIDASDTEATTEDAPADIEGGGTGSDVHVPGPSITETVIDTDAELTLASMATMSAEDFDRLTDEQIRAVLDKEIV